MSAVDFLSQEELRELSRRSDLPGIVHLALHFALLGGTGFIVWSAVGTPWLVPAMVLHGVPLVFLFMPHHEAIHQSAFRSPWLTKAVTWVLGLIVFYPPEYFRFWHLTHHRFTQDPERDPEIVPPPVKSPRGYLWWVIGLPYLLRRTETLKIALSGKVTKSFVPEQRKPEIVREARAAWSVYLGVAVLAAFTDPWAPVLYWLGPYMLAQPVLRLYQLAEHTGMEFTDDILRNTRTTRSNAFVRWLAWNMPYHTEHHLYPGVPFHALPRLHERVKHRLRAVSGGYVAANRRIWRSISQQQ